ncbi:MAG: hypothetical protein QOE51_407 [Actinoplanes sp.]|nr:hypothetical protein [Actinoplanes sp.]
MSTATHATIHPFPAPAAPQDTPERGRPAPVGSITYTVAEVAEMLRINLGGTYKMIRSGEIPSRKLGGRWVIPRRAFHEWINSLERVTPAEAEANRRASIGELTDEERDLIWAHRNRAHRPGGNGA